MLEIYQVDTHKKKLNYAPRVNSYFANSRDTCCLWKCIKAIMDWECGNIYRCTFKSILSTCINDWYGSKCLTVRPYNEQWRNHLHFSSLHATYQWIMSHLHGISIMKTPVNPATTSSQKAQANQGIIYQVRQQLFTSGYEDPQRLAHPGQHLQPPSFSSLIKNISLPHTVCLTGIYRNYSKIKLQKNDNISQAVE